VLVASFGYTVYAGNGNLSFALLNVYMVSAIMSVMFEKTALIGPVFSTSAFLPVSTIVPNENNHSRTMTVVTPTDMKTAILRFTPSGFRRRREMRVNMLEPISLKTSKNMNKKLQVIFLTIPQGEW